MSVPFQRIGVIGAGAWGAALAQTCANAGRDVVLWARRAEHAAAIQSTRENAERLPGVRLHDAIRATGELGEAGACDAILMAAPAQSARAVLTRLVEHAGENVPIVSCAKGLERGGLAPMSDVIRETVPQARVAVLSGPSFAGEVARGLPAAVTLAGEDLELAADLAASIGWAAFRPYLSDDIAGAEIGGAMKNVLAIACGAAEGLQLGASAHAGLITRGFAEMTRLGAALGARPETMQGLSGLGDLVLTCSSPQSRNMSLGRALGQGRSLEEIMGGRSAVTEGVATAPAMVSLARRHGVETPICDAVDAVLAGRFTVREAVDGLLSRAVKVETA